MAIVADPPATRRLREFHQLGQKLLRASQLGSRSRAGEVKNFWGVNEELQKKHGLSLNDIACARRFAQLYSPEQLDELCRLGQKRGKRRESLGQLGYDINSNCLVDNKTSEQAVITWTPAFRKRSIWASHSVPGLKITRSGRMASSSSMSPP